MSSHSQRRYLLAILTLVLAFNYVDRYALGLVQEDIKHELALSDSQIGFMSGFAFALFYAVMGIPIARWADTGNRVRIIWVTTLLWSVAAAFCGMVTSFAQLLVARVAVAVGEAGCLPPAHSLISDYFKREGRARAVAIFMLGGPISLVIGFFAAGWINELYGWRVTFMTLACPGVALALAVALTLRDPRFRGLTDASNSGAGGAAMGAEQNPSPSWRTVYAALRNNRTFRHLLFCFAVLHFFGSGIGQWQPTFFIRSYGLSTGTLGTLFALTFGLAGLVGTYVGGELASRFAANNERVQLRSIAIACAAFSLFSALIYLSPAYPKAFGFLAIAAFGGAAINGPMFATIQNVVPAPMRAVSIAIIYLFANLIGMGLGPLAAGALSDLFRPAVGEESLRYALLCLCPGYLWAGWHCWQAARSVGPDLDHAQAAERVPAGLAPPSAAETHFNIPPTGETA